MTKPLPGHLGQEKDTERRPLEERLGFAVGVFLGTYLSILLIVLLVVRGVIL
jgi:hypothetical protein